MELFSQTNRILGQQTILPVQQQLQLVDGSQQATTYAIQGSDDPLIPVQQQQILMLVLLTQAVATIDAGAATIQTTGIDEHQQLLQQAQVIDGSLQQATQMIQLQSEPVQDQQANEEDPAVEAERNTVSPNLKASESKSQARAGRQDPERASEVSPRVTAQACNEPSS
ncbi:hypothetical protein Ciccas_012833 [Cichlidogyrus casuarinus]|uniref:Uncharacterized protein n=1 Tax=Cichlidogyrus casuarinus TaxID=1844966 RepID=A0ABD2PS99_9PLAT